MARLGACLLTAVLTATAFASTYTVTSTSDSGAAGALRWAIGQANGHAGADSVVFSAGMAGKTILPLSPLPALTDNQTTINGDFNGDGDPDILLSGASQGSGSGLWLDGADFCTIRGLAIGNMPSRGLALTAADSCVVRNCHLGVNLAGTATLPNGGSDLGLCAAHYNTIGGSGAATRNLIGCGGTPTHYGIEVSRSLSNTISGNYIGLRGTGGSALGTGGIGVGLVGDLSGQSTSNVVGGDTAAERNLFGGLYTGAKIVHGDANAVQGNHFGLAAGGTARTVVPVTL